VEIEEIGFGGDLGPSKSTVAPNPPKKKIMSHNFRI